MEKKYVSVDVETTGPVPGVYSMISLGACIVGDTSKQFYREIAPLNENYVLEALNVAALGIERFRNIDVCDPLNSKFDPKTFMNLLSVNMDGPRRVMNDYIEWIERTTKGFKPVEVAAPIKFDGAFTSWYFHNVGLGNPFRHSGEDINSMYRGVMNDLTVHVRDLGFRGDGLPHNALEDAIIQAKEFEAVLDLMKK